MQQVVQRVKLQVSNRIFLLFLFEVTHFNIFFIENIKANNIRTNAKAAFEQVDNNPSATSGELASAGKNVMAEMKRADAIQG